VTEDEAHRRIREQLGSYALGHLAGEGEDAVRAHLDGCADCREELGSIASLRQALSAVDITRLGAIDHPPAHLGDRIRRTVAEEQAAAAQDEEARREEGRRRRSLRRTVLATAAAAVVLTVAVGGAWWGRATAPEPEPPPLEPIALRAVEPVGPSVTESSVVPHTWGLEVRFVGSGFTRGEIFHGVVRRVDGTTMAAGEFIGTGPVAVVCNLQSAVLRSDATRFLVKDEEGRTVLAARLPRDG
jgi:hypothetical protein